MKRLALMFLFMLVETGACLGGCSFTPGAAPQPGPCASRFGEPCPDARIAVDAAALTDTAASTDSASGSDAVPAQTVTLRETATDTPTTISAWCQNAGVRMDDNAWLRAFRLTDFGMSTGLHIGTVAVTTTASRGGVIAVTIYSYAGQVGGSTLDPLGPVLATTGALAIADPSPVGAVLTIDVPVSADVVAGSSFVVEIAETDQRNTSGQLTSYFHLAANGDAQTAPSYWRSDACSDPQPRLEASGSIFSVIGYTE